VTFLDVFQAHAQSNWAKWDLPEDFDNNTVARKTVRERVGNDLDHARHQTKAAVRRASHLCVHHHAERRVQIKESLGKQDETSKAYAGPFAHVAKLTQDLCALHKKARLSVSVEMLARVAFLVSFPIP
jgi:hypothetical protein